MMNKGLLVNKFEAWFRANGQRLKTKGIAAEIKLPEFETQALDKANIGLQSESVVASFTVWGEGAVEIIILSKSTGEEVLVEDRQVQTSDEMLSMLDYYCNLIEDRSSFIQQQST